MKDNIYRRMTINSWARDWFATISFIVFAAISVAMISLTTMLFMNLTGAINHLMEVAKTPDYLQMHTGEIDTEVLEDFALGRSEVLDYQVLPFLNLDNSILTLSGQSLLDSTQDNGISIQGDGFDYMVDLQNELPTVLPGQVYVPICYESVYHVKTGDVLNIGGEELTVAGFIRDSQMNAMMASSKRFLVCAEDYEKLSPMGSEEYLIEFLLEEGADSNAFKTAYENASLPMNGPTITGPLIKMMNTLSDGIMILIILLISLLVLLISLVCIRFLLLTRIVSEAGEVGMLKAVGISGKEIRRMFLKRYVLLVFVGAVLGVIFSGMMFRPLSAQMQKLYGVSGSSYEIFIFALLSAVLVGSAIILFVLRILRQINAMTAVKALAGDDGEEKKKNNKFCIAFVMVIAIFLMLIPSNLYSTLSSPEFVTYMGIGNAQIRMDLREGAESSEAFGRIDRMLSEDSEVLEYALYQTCSTPVRLGDGTTMNLLMEQGNHLRFPVAYSSGSAPAREGEVALSYLLSEELGLSPGDTLWVKRAGEYELCTISGIYSDITNGGKTVKIYTKDLENAENVMWRIVYVTLTEGTDQKDFIDRYTEEGVEVVDIASRVRGTYGPTLAQVRQAAILIKMIAFLIIFVVIMLFVRMMIANLRNQLSVKKALGFRSIDLKKDFWKSCLPYVIAGIFLGTFSGCILGEDICGVALQSLGAVGFRFALDIRSILGNILFGSLSAIVAIYLGSNGIKNVKAVECCKGRE
ncbi:MAG: hypothetical protein J6K26_07255 [Lachnospiraceae bacterium]|nr:hypothetical protein [Lachnospiraceae bacterium]